MRVAGCIPDSTEESDSFNDLELDSQIIYCFLLLVKCSLAIEEKKDVPFHFCYPSFLGQTGLVLFPQVFICETAKKCADMYLEMSLKHKLCTTCS